MSGDQKRQKNQEKPEPPYEEMSGNPEKQKSQEIPAPLFKEISGDQEKQKKQEIPHPESEKKIPGFCAQAPMSRQSLREEIKKPELKTSDVFHTCNLPARFEHPHWFNGYGCQVSRQHPFYRTTSNEYGWYAPGYHSVPSVFFPAGQTFTNHLAAAGMYRNYSLNTGMDPAGYS